MSGVRTQDPETSPAKAPVHTSSCRIPCKPRVWQGREVSGVCQSLCFKACVDVSVWRRIESCLSECWNEGGLILGAQAQRQAGSGLRSTSRLPHPADTSRAFPTQQRPDKALAAPLSLSHRCCHFSASTTAASSLSLLWLSPGGHTAHPSVGTGQDQLSSATLMSNTQEEEEEALCLWLGSLTLLRLPLTPGTRGNVHYSKSLMLPLTE